MKKDLLVSEYKNNVLAKKSKVFFASLTDYFSTLLLSFVLLIGVANPIASLFSGYQNTVSEISFNYNELTDIISSTRLVEIDEKTKETIDINVTSRKYIENLVKTSCYVYQINYIYYNSETKEYINKIPDISETFVQKTTENSDVISYPNDNLLYYYLVFKTENEDLNSYIYNGNDVNNNKIDYFYKNILTFDVDGLRNNFITNTDYLNLEETIQNELNRFNILNEISTKNMIQYLVYNDTSSESVTNLYNYLNNAYQNATQFFINEVEANYTPYINTRLTYNNIYSRFVIYNVLTLLSSYIVSFIILFIVLPIFLKKKTLGLKIFKLGFSRIDELEPSKLNYFLYYLVIFILYFSSALFSSFFINNMGVLSFNLFNTSFNFFQIIMFTLLIGILSYLYLAFNKNHQTISLLVSNMVIKQTDEYEKNESEENLIIDNNEQGK